MNLLPPQEKEELARKNYQKLVIVLGNAVLISLGCLALVLFSLKFYILQEARYYENVLNDIAQSRQAPDEFSLKGVIEKYNTSMMALDGFYKKEVYVNDALKVIFETERPGGLYLKSVLIDRDAQTNKLKIRVVGFSSAREHLLAYKKDLESNEKIESVYFPPESWISSKNVEFAITLEIKKP